MHPAKQKRLFHLQKQLNWLQSVESKLLSKDRQFFWYRLTAFSAAWIGALLARLFVPGPWWAVIFLLFVFSFLLIVFLHRRLDALRARYQNTRQWVGDQIARLSLNWEAIPEPEAAEPPAPGHPFAADLNLEGAKSLLHLLDVTRSLGGSARLRNWLLQPDLDPRHISARQAHIRELSALPGFRRAYQTLRSADGQESAARWNEQSLSNWLKDSAPQPAFNTWLAVLTLLAVLNMSLFLLALVGALPAVWQFGLILYAAVYLFRYQTYKSLFEEAFSLNQSLLAIKKLFNLLEFYPFSSTGTLKELTACLRAAGQRPSKIIRKIAWLTSAASLQNNQILWLLVNLFIPWDLWFAKLLNGQKSALRNLVPLWLECWYEIDALASLANFAYINPEYHFPLLIAAQNETQPLLQATEMGHPLLAPAGKVTNSFSVNHLGEIALITGSNMSGKSTFLRTTGVNLLLAFSGAPVNADEMRLVLLRLFTCIQVSDSLSDGFSYFYAEVRRLKSLLNLLEEAQTGVPVFYLIDEIFRGTNNRERRIGSQSFVRALARLPGSGVISTHDLELVKLADGNQRILNYHFRDDVLDGRMIFDYKLRPGPSPSTNALKIMKNEGLPVEE
jgi:hypothetical protein